MRFFAETVFNHIRGQMEDHLQQSHVGNRLLFMVPSVPSGVVLETGKRLVDYCVEETRMAQPVIRVASDLCREWETSGDAGVKGCLDEIVERGWRDDRGSLTSYRNEGSPANGLSVVLLIGVDRVTDRASLADFHHCDFQTLWVTGLQGSFGAWVERAMDDASVAFEEDTLAHFDSVLVPLVERGLADILQISALLERLDLSAAQDGKDAEDALLRGLGRLGLPSFAGYRFSGLRSFAPYLDDAVTFFAYDMFLEDRARQGAMKAVDHFVEYNELGELFDPSLRGSFATDEAFLAGLQAYIGTRDPEQREKLRQCDFITIRDRVLKFRPPKEARPKTQRVRKLAGGPVEVVLTGLWVTLADFKQEAARRGVFAHEALREVRIKSLLFKHDVEGETSDDTSEARTRNARAYLERLLGGVDSLLAEGLQQGALCGDDGEVPVHSALVRDDLACQPCRSAEPCLEFSIELVGDEWEEPVEGRFAWRLPEIQTYRVAHELVYWAAEAVNRTDDYCLPVFHVPYYEELMLAEDDEETQRVLLQCIQNEDEPVFNLLRVSDLDREDPLLPRCEKLAFAYDRLLQTARGHGLHAALGEEWVALRKAYEEACDGYLCEQDCADSPLASLLHRAFLLVAHRATEEGERWVWEGHERSGVVTVLHPALLEMLQAHVQYLLTCFSAVATRELRAAGARSFREATWRSYVDLAAIQMPLCGLIRDRNRSLETQIRGENLLHRVGSTGEAQASLTTRLLLRYDAFDEEDVSDAELFRESRESVLISRLLTDYRRLHPHADDGLSIAVYQNKDIQPVISAVNRFLVDVCAERDSESRKYAMSVTVFTESSDDTSVSRWISQWRERWQAAETQNSLAHYRQTHLSISHRIVSPEDYYDQFRRLIAEGLEVDIAVLNGFIGAGSEGNDFDLVEQYDVTSRTLKFPILEKSFCARRDPGRQLQRARVLSNRQFRLTTRHAEVMARLKNRETAQNTSHVVLGSGDYTPWQGVVDELHKRAEWVVCIDPNIDERLIALKGSDTQEAREIIGFGSGVGSHGEANYTISTEQFRLSDVLSRVTASIGEVYSAWSPEVRDEVAQGVLAGSRRLSGLSLVRAIGISEYIRDFMAYALTRKLLVPQNGVFCDELVSLDAYRHWFDSAESDSRPDLLWLVAELGDDGRMHLGLRLLECKLAKQSGEHLERAHLQLENGLRHLMAMFMPRVGRERIEDERPDQRYWWLQLHRLIASKAEVSGREQARVLTALERLAEGDYDVEWRAAAVAFWTDRTDASPSRIDTWSFGFEGQEVGIDVISVGSECVSELCTSDKVIDLPWDGEAVRLAADAPETVIAADDDGADGSGDDDGRHRQAGPTPGGDPDHVPQEGSGTRGSADPEPSPPVATEVTIPDRIPLGVTERGSRPVYWEFGHPELGNRHMLIFGTSGMGKTYTIQCLLCELGLCGQNSLIVDYTSGFFENQLEEEFRALLRPQQHVVRTTPLAINPFRQQREVIGDETIPEGPGNTAQRVSGVFAEVYNFGDQQKSALYQAVKSGMAQRGGKAMTLRDLIPCLEDITEEKGTVGSSAASAISRLRPFVDQNPFGPEDPASWERLFTDPEHRCHVLQLAGFMRDSSRLITEFSLIDLYWFYRTHGTKDSPRVVVLDEVQNLDHRDESPLAQLLREGRKFGFSLILATQIMSNLEKDERDRLFNAAHKLFFRPADTELRTYANIAAATTGEKADLWIPRLASLHQGECYSLGPSLNEATGKLETKTFKLKVTPIAERVPHA